MNSKIFDPFCVYLSCSWVPVQTAADQMVSNLRILLRLHRAFVRNESIVAPFPSSFGRPGTPLGPLVDPFGLPWAHLGPPWICPPGGLADITTQSMGSKRKDGKSRELEIHQMQILAFSIPLGPRSKNTRQRACRARPCEAILAFKIVCRFFVAFPICPPGGLADISELSCFFDAASLAFSFVFPLNFATIESGYRFFVAFPICPPGGLADIPVLSFLFDEASLAFSFVFPPNFATVEAGVCPQRVHFRSILVVFWSPLDPFGIPFGPLWDHLRPTLGSLGTPLDMSARRSRGHIGSVLFCRLGFPGVFLRFSTESCYA